MKLTSLQYVICLLCSVFITVLSTTDNVIRIQYEEILPIYCGATYVMDNSVLDQSIRDLRLIVTHPETQITNVNISSDLNYTHNLIKDSNIQRYQSVINFTRNKTNDIIVFKVQCHRSEWIIEGELGVTSESNDKFISNFMYSTLTLNLNQTGITYIKRTNGFLYSSNNCEVDIYVNNTIIHSGKNGYVVFPEGNSNEKVIELKVNVTKYIINTIYSNISCTIYIQEYTLNFDNDTYVHPVNISSQYFPPGFEFKLNSSMNIIVTSRFIAPMNAYVEMDLPLDKEQNIFIRPNGNALKVSGHNNLNLPLQKMGYNDLLLQFTLINLNKYTPENSFNYFLIIHSSDEVPELISVNKYYSTLLFGNMKYNLYTHISNNKGKIIVSAEQGVVKTCLQIIPLNTNDNNKSHITYTQICENSLDTFETNQLIFDITEQHTEQCNKGCELLLALEFVHINLNEPYFLLPVDIAVIIEETTPTTVPFNQYVYGLLDTNDTFSYYNFTIPSNMSRVSFTVNGNDIEMYINYGESKPTKENYHFKLISNSTLTITNTEIKSTTITNFKDSIFTIGIISNNIKNNKLFNVAIYPQFTNIILNLFDSNQFGYCNSNNAYNGTCYFITPWHSTGMYSSTKLKLYDTNYNLLNDTTQITAVLINKTEFEKLSFTKAFPDVFNTDQKSLDIFTSNNNVLTLHNKQTDIMEIYSVAYHGILDKYMIIKVEKVSGEFYLFHQTNEHITFNHITSNYLYKTYHIDDSFGVVSFKFNSTKQYYFEVENGRAKVNNQRMICHSFVSYDPYVNFTETEKNPLDIMIKPYSSLQKLTLNKQSNAELIDINYGKSFYVEVPNKGTVRVYIKLDFEYGSNDFIPLGSEKFEVKAFLVNSDFISNRTKTNDFILPETNEIINIHMFQEDNTIIFETTTDEINNIIFFNVKALEDNNRIYCVINSIIDIYLISDTNTYIQMKPDQYYMEYIDTNILNKLIYEISCNECTFLEMEFSEKGYQKLLDFSVEPLNDNIKYANDTSIIEKASNHYGKIKLTFSQKGLDSKKIILTVFNTQIKDTSKVFFIKYSYENNDYDSKLKDNSNIQQFKDNNTIYLTLPTNIDNDNQIRYIFRLYQKNQIFKRKLLNSYFEEDNEVETLPSLNVTLEYLHYQPLQTYIINTTNLIGNHYLTMLGILGNDHKIKHRTSIEPIEIELSNDFPGITILIFLLCIVISIAMSILILCFYIKKNYKSKKIRRSLVDGDEYGYNY